MSDPRLIEFLSFGSFSFALVEESPLKRIWRVRGCKEPYDPLGIFVSKDYPQVQFRNMDAFVLHCIREHGEHKDG